MQNPTDQAEAEALIPTEMNRTVKCAEKLQSAPFLVTWQQKSYSCRKMKITATKKPRLEEPLPTTTDEAARKTASPDVSIGPSHPAVADGDDANADAVTDTQPNAESSNRATGRWTLEEDAKLTSALANTSKKKCGKEYKTDWDIITALVPGRTRKQCNQRWHDVLDPIIDRASGRTGKWTAVEDSKLKNAVQTYGGMNWGAITALVPGRTKSQCKSRWFNALNPNIDRAYVRKGKWTAIEDSKLKDAVQSHGCKDWVVISALVPGRTKMQCCHRWHDALNPIITLAAGREGKWTADEDSKLKDAVQTHGGKDWATIAALVPGRTRLQCRSRWHFALDPSIDRTPPGRTGKWTEGEDMKLKDAVHTHGGKNWAAIAALVPGRTTEQCRGRWKKHTDPNRN
jgi:hypothetical protein